MGGDVEQRLREWGAYYGQRERPEVSRSERTRHMLAGVQVATGRRAKRDTVKRSGYTRRLIMGRAAGIGHAIAMAFVDPVPCKETRSSGYQPERPVPMEAQAVEAAVKALEAANLLRGLCLRASYCVNGDRNAKADWVTVQFRQAKHDARAITVGTLKHETALARAWVEGRLGYQAAVPQPA